uniref:Uncharacterized protein n=1 Tax=Romanomermis culicivorax TaxID=13658 RepID=A0A915JL13_ROMCU
MLFNKASQQAVTIRSVEQTDQKLPLLEIVPQTPTCHFDQMFHAFMSTAEELHFVEDDGKMHMPFILLATEFCKQASYNKNSCILQLMNNTARYIRSDELFTTDDLKSKPYIYLVQTAERFY